MAVAELEKLRNFGILGQGGSGKTSLGEAMLFAAGATQRLGKVQDGTSVLDHEPEEIKHHVSISTSFHSLAWKKFPLTLIDTPGYAAFLADSINSMRGFGGAVFVLNPVVGLRVESERLWERANENRVSRLLFVSKMDHEQADVEERIAPMLETLECKGIYLQMPIGAEANFKGIVDLIAMKACIYEGDTGKFVETEIPSDLKSAADEWQQKMVEDVCETDDQLLEKFLDGQELSTEELKKAIREGTRERKIFPILFGSALRQIGIAQLLDAVADYLPSPLDEGEAEGHNPANAETIKRAADPTAPFSAYVFKTVIDPFAGKLSIMRVMSGKIAPDVTCYVPSRQVKEKMGHIFRLEGKRQEAVKDAVAGEIIAAAKFKDIATGDTLCDEKAPIVYEGAAHFAPNISFALEPKSKADEDKLPQGLHRIMEEDQTIAMHRDEETRDFILSGMGQQHIEIIVEKLKRKYGAEVVLKAPKVPYKETIRGSASAEGRLKKQTGCLYDGSYHDVDSSDMAFKIAASMGFKNAIEKAKPVLLEPIMNMEISVPDECMGDVIGDLNSRRGKVLGMDTKGHTQVIKSRVPMSEVLKYAPDLRSITSGRGEFHMEFAHYEELPAHLAEKVIKEAKASKSAEHNGEHKA